MIIVLDLEGDSDNSPQAGQVEVSGCDDDAQVRLVFSSPARTVSLLARDLKIALDTLSIRQRYDSD
jgi:hypothetical protein